MLDTRPLLNEPFEDTHLLRFPEFEDVPGFVHAITTRPWNMAPHRGPEADQAVARRRRVCARLGLDFERLTAADQIHSGHVVRVGPADAGHGRFGRDTAVKFVDGLVTDVAGLPLLQLSADCLLILAVDPERRAVGTAHASWRGTVARIASNLIGAMKREYGCDPGALRVGLAPCASPPRYEVGEDVCRIARAMLPEWDEFLPPSPSGKRCFDLKMANWLQLREAGVRPERIVIAAECTMADGRFYSHRREGEGTGRFALFAGFL